jgi:hypothetical protein
MRRPCAFPRADHSHGERPLLHVIAARQQRHQRQGYDSCYHEQLFHLLLPCPVHFVPMGENRFGMHFQQYSVCSTNDPERSCRHVLPSLCAVSQPSRESRPSAAGGGAAVLACSSQGEPHGTALRGYRIWSCKPLYYSRLADLNKGGSVGLTGGNVRTEPKGEAWRFPILNNCTIYI